MQNTFTGASAVPFNPQSQTFTPAINPSINTITPKNQYGELINPTKQDVASFNSKYTTYTPTADQNLQAYLKQNPVISATDLNVQKINLPTFSPAPVMTPKTNDAQTGIQNIPTPIATADTDMRKMLLQLAPQLQGEGQELAAQQKTLGVETMRTNLQNLNNQILQKQAELSAQDVSLAQGLQNIEDQTIPMEFITGQQLSLEKRANLAKAVKVSQINMLNASALATQGNIALAQDQAQKAVDAKFAPIKEMYNTIQNQLQILQPLLTREEKQIAAQQSLIAETQKQMIDYKINQQKNVSNLLMQSQANGVDPQTYTQALNAFNNGKSDVEIAGILGPYGGKDYLANKDLIDMSRNTQYNSVGQLTVDNGYTLDLFKKGISGVESAGSGGYSAVGPATKSGDKAYGKYQVMGVNIPSWTKEALGYTMTPQEFLKSPDAQEKVFEFQSMKNYAKYGNWDDVASVWFSGRPLANNVSSDGYNTVPQYVSKVRNAMGVSAQPTTLSMVTNPNAELWGKEYLKTGKINDIPKAYQTMALAYANQNKTNTPEIQSLTEKINLIDSVLNSSAISSVVGPTFGTRGGTLSGVLGKTATGLTVGAGTGAAVGGVATTPLLGIGAVPGAVLGGLGGGAIGLATGIGQSIPFLTGEAQNFIGSVEQLSNKQFLEEIINLKKEAGGIGSLTEEEGRKLGNAATKINNWAVKDGNGKVIGYAIDEENFIKELNLLKSLAQKGIVQAGGNILGGTPTDVYYQLMSNQLKNAGSTQATYGYNF